MTASNRLFRIMVGYLFVTTVAMLVMLVSGFGKARPHFEEIDVERINIVEKGGKLRMAITDKERSPGPIGRGVPYGPSGGRRPGLIFYNDEGTENGGLIFGSYKKGDRLLEAGALLAFDQYDQDQCIALQYYEHDGRRRYGLGIGEYPTSITNRQRSE